MVASISPLASARKRSDTAWNGWKICSEKDRGCHVNLWLLCNHQVGGISSSPSPEILTKSTWNSLCSGFGQEKAEFGGHTISPASQPSIPRCPNKWFIVDAMLHALFSLNSAIRIPKSALKKANFFVDATSHVLWNVWLQDLAPACPTNACL
jgi:hypothetical protein